MCVVPAPFGGDVTIYSSTQIPHILKIQLAIVSGSRSTGSGSSHRRSAAASGRSSTSTPRRCSRSARVRLERPVRWIEERSENTHATTQGRGMIQEIELAADADGRITAVRAPPRRHGRVPPAGHAGHPVARRVRVPRRVRHPRVLVHVHGRLHEQDADGRVPRCGAAGGDVRDRAGDRRARGRVGVDPVEIGGGTSSPPTSSPTRPPPGSSSTAATTSPRSTGRSRSSATTSVRADQRRAVPAATRSTSASACRPMSRCAGSRRAACSVSRTSVPADGTHARCGCSPPARSRWSPVPRRTGRVTRRGGR